MLKVRKFDDKLINILNTELPTESFHKDPIAICNDIRQEFTDYYDSRESSIKSCVEYASKELEKLKSSKDASLSSLSEKSHNLRIFQQELDIETIYKARGLKVFYIFLLF